MEFESTSQASRSPDITDEQRIDASNRHVTLEPLHADLAPDDLPDEYVANQHILEPPIANLESDTESTKPAASSSSSTQRNLTLTVVVVLATICAGIAGAYLFFSR